MNLDLSIRVPIIIPSSGRIDYLTQCLESIKPQIDERHVIYIGAEPALHPHESVCRSIIPGVTFIRNTTTLTCNHNWASLVEMVRAIGFDRFVYVEDDCVLSPDALRLSDFFFSLNTFREFTAGALWFVSGDACINYPEAIFPYRGYGWPSKAVCMLLSQWDACVAWHASRNEPGYQFTATECTLDVKFAEWNRMHKQGFVCPILSRAKDIGRLGGCCVTPERYDENYSKLKHRVDPYEGEYKLLFA